MNFRLGSLAGWYGHSVARPRNHAAVEPGRKSLYKAELYGAETERLRPWIVDTARALWKIYLILTLAEFLCLLFAGMDPFEALCHAFSTLGTGGFSTCTASVGAFGNPLVEYIVIVFMLFAGINFVQHFHLWVERDPWWCWPTTGTTPSRTLPDTRRRTRTRRWGA